MCFNVNQSPSCVAFNRTRLRIGTQGISRADVNSPALQLCCATLGRSKHDGARQAPNLPALVQAGASVNVPHSNAPLRSNACVVWSTHTRTYARRCVCVCGRVEGRSMECVTTWQHDSKMLDQNREASEASARFHKATRAQGVQPVAGQDATRSDRMQC
jgi:hypothetical protein